MSTQMTLPKVSIITVNFNGKKYIENFFASLSRLSYPDWEVICIDNASTDGSVKLIRSLMKIPPPPRSPFGHLGGVLRLIENKRNLGFALAINKAAKAARGKYLFFLNNDARIETEAISVMVKKMQTDSKVGICGSRIMSYDGKRHFHTGIGMDIFGYPIVWKKVFYIEGSALMISKKLFEELDGFDPRYFMFHEDIDLAWRVRLLGYKVMALPKAIVCHVGGAQAGGGEKDQGRYYSSFMRRYHSERNNIRTLIKNYHWLSLLVILPFYMLINLAEILFSLIMLQPRAAGCYLRAHWWNFVNLPETLKERGRVQKSRRVSDWSILSGMYFGSGKLFAIKKAGLPKFR